MLSQSTTPHRISAIEALVAGAAADGDGAADVAGGGVGLELGPLLAQGVDDDGEAKVGAGGAGGWRRGLSGAFFVVARHGDGVGRQAAVAVAVFLFGARDG